MGNRRFREQEGVTGRLQSLELEIVRLRQLLYGPSGYMALYHSFRDEVRALHWLLNHPMTPPYTEEEAKRWGGK